MKGHGKKAIPLRPSAAPASDANDKAEIFLIREKTVALVEKSPDKAAKILSLWVNAPSFPARKKAG